MELSLWTEALIILMLIAANGFFSGAEIAILSARKGRLQGQAEQGDRKARLALELIDSPERFLPAVQVGITFVGTFAAAFGGARFVVVIGQLVERVPVPWIAQRSETIALGIIVLGISFLSVVLGELVPKQLALRYSHFLSRLVAGPMHLVAKAFAPAIWVLGRTTDLVLLLFGIRGKGAQPVLLDDVRQMIEMGMSEGVVEQVEHHLATEALRLSDRSVKDILQPRIEIDAVDITTPAEEVLGVLAMAGMTRLPVYEGDLDHIVGYVDLRDVVRYQYMKWPIDLHKLIQPALFVPETVKLDQLLVLFQEQGKQFAVVVDEFGGTEGIVTLEDLVDELVGEVEPDEDEGQRIVQRDPSSWLLDGKVGIDEMVDELELNPDLFPPSRGFATVAGLILNQLKRIPNVGEKANWEHLHFEVVDMDGPRIDRVLVTRGEPTDGRTETE